MDQKTIEDLILTSLDFDTLEGLNASIPKTDKFDDQKIKLIKLYIELIAKTEKYKEDILKADVLNDAKRLQIFTTSLDLVNFINDYATSSDNKEYWEKVATVIKSNKDKIKGYFVESDDKTTLKIIDDFKLEDNQVACYIDKEGKILDNFLPMDNYRLQSIVVDNIAPYMASAIGIFNNDDLENPIGYLLLNKLERHFGKRLYRVGIMSDIHYNDYQIDSYENAPNHVDGGGQYIEDLKNAFRFYEDKDEVRFICAAGDITTNNMEHMVNFKSLLAQTCPTTPFYTCFGNHDYRATSKYNTVDEEFADYAQLGVLGMTRLDMWNSLMVPQDSEYEIHYQDPNTGYGKTSFWFEVPTVNGKSDIYAFLSVNYLNETSRVYGNNIAYHDLSQDYLYVDTTKSGGSCEKVDVIDDYNIAIKYTASSQRILYDYHNVENYTYSVKIIDAKVVDADGNDVTSQLDSSNPYIGFYGTDGKYHLSGEVEVHRTSVSEISSDNMLEIPISSKFEKTYPDIKLPVTLYVKGQHISNAKYSEISTAGLKLDSNSPYEDEIEQYLKDNNVEVPTSYNIKFYDNQALIWLKDLLESNPEKRIFIFTHQFFPQKSGSNIGPGYSYGMDSSKIGSSQSYCLCGVQFEFLNLLNNKFKNTIWFTGHSHYNYDTQITDRTVTVCNHDYKIFRPDDSDFTSSKRYYRRGGISNDINNPGTFEVVCESGYNVHVPSTSRPLASNISSTRKLTSKYSNALQSNDSEGMIMDIYENYVDIRGVTLKDQNSYPDQWINKYHPLGQYRIYVKSR